MIHGPCNFHSINLIGTGFIFMVIETNLLSVICSQVIRESTAEELFSPAHVTPSRLVQLTFCFFSKKNK